MGLNASSIHQKWLIVMSLSDVFDARIVSWRLTPRLPRFGKAKNFPSVNFLSCLRSVVAGL